MTGTRD